MLISRSKYWTSSPYCCLIEVISPEFLSLTDTLFSPICTSDERKKLTKENGFRLWIQSIVNTINGQDYLSLNSHDRT